MVAKSEAIEIANKHVLEHHGLKVGPLEVHFIDRFGAPPYWHVHYGTKVYYPEETAAGAIIDGGEYMLWVDAATGGVTVCE